MVIHLKKCESCHGRGFHVWAPYIALVETDMTFGLGTRPMRLCKVCLEVYRPIIIEYWGLAEWERLNEIGYPEETSSIS